MSCFRCIEEDGQDVAVEQAELKPEREVTRSPNFFESVEGAAILSNLGDDLFGCGSRVLDGAAKIFEIDYLFHVVITTFDFHRWTASCHTFGFTGVDIESKIFCFLLNAREQLEAVICRFRGWQYRQQNLGRSAGDHLGVAQLSRRSSVRNRWRLRTVAGIARTLVSPRRGWEIYMWISLCCLHTTGCIFIHHHDEIYYDIRDTIVAKELPEWLAV